MVWGDLEFSLNLAGYSSGGFKHELCINGVTKLASSNLIAERIKVFNQADDVISLVVVERVVGRFALNSRNEAVQLQNLPGRVVAPTKMDNEQFQLIKVNIRAAYNYSTAGTRRCA
jgi:hypothetical protein